MLKNEFEERIGRSVSQEEYDNANCMYMAAGDIDKDTFCREWKKCGYSPLVLGLFDTAYKLSREISEYKVRSYQEKVKNYRSVLDQIRIEQYKSYESLLDARKLLLSVRCLFNELCLAIDSVYNVFNELLLEQEKEPEL